MTDERPTALSISDQANHTKPPPSAKRVLCPAAIHRIPPTYKGGHLMEFTAQFLGLTVALLVAWLGPRSLTVALFAATFIISIAIYLHHATDRLPLSF
jgi:Family of unknown function (DUF5993)